MNLDALSQAVESILTPLFLQKTCDIYRYDDDAQGEDLSPENEPRRIYSVVKCDVVTIKDAVSVPSAGRLEERVGLQVYLPLSVHVLDGDKVVMRESGNTYYVKGADTYEPSAGLNMAYVSERQ